MFTLVTAEKRELYKLELGHDGWTSGCGYDGDDEWHQTFYGETPLEICEKVLESNLTLNAGNIFHYYKSEVLIYDNQIFDIRTISEFSKYSKDDILISEYHKLFEIFRNKTLENK